MLPRAASTCPPLWTPLGVFSTPRVPPPHTLHTHTHTDGLFSFFFSVFQNARPPATPRRLGGSAPHSPREIKNLIKTRRLPGRVPLPGCGGAVYVGAVRLWPRRRRDARATHTRASAFAADSESGTSSDTAYTRTAGRRQRERLARDRPLATTFRDINSVGGRKHTRPVAGQDALDVARRAADMQ